LIAFEFVSSDHDNLQALNSNRFQLLKSSSFTTKPSCTSTHSPNQDQKLDPTLHYNILSHPSIFSKFFRLSRSLGYSSLLAHIFVLAARLTVERKVFYAQPALPPFNTMRSVYTRTHDRGEEEAVKK
jgi:hypothetical protein